MNISNNRKISKLILLVMILSILTSSFVSCKTGDKSPYVAESKEVIEANIDATFSGKLPNYKYVYKYLLDWGVPIFNTTKFSHIEESFIALFNYADGLPSCSSHARLTAEKFLKEYYDKIDHSDKTAVTDALLTCYVSVLGDPYSIYRPPVEADEYTTDMSGKFGGIGVVVEYNYDAQTIMVNTVYIDSPAEKAGIKVGDYIHAVNGATVEELGLTNVVNHIRGKIGTTVNITMLRNGELVEVNATRAEVEELTVDYAFDEEKKFGYVQIASFKNNTYEQFAEAVYELEELGAVGIIFDLRNNPGGYLHSVCDSLSFLIPNGKTIVSYQYKGKLPTEYVSDADEFNGTSSDHVISVPIVVLCNQYTASAGEIFAATIRDYSEGESPILSATIVGVNTYGKGIMQNTYGYYDGSTITLTVAYYNPPSGENYHGVGVEPEIEIELPDAVYDPESGKYLPIEDTQYNAAVAELERLVNAN